MAKYTVIMTQAHIRYTQAVVEVEAEQDAASNDIYALAMSHPVEWTDQDGEHLGHCDVEISSEHGCQMTWRED
jgi:hypothetical protein